MDHIYSIVERRLVPFPFLGTRFRPNLIKHIGEGTYGHVYSLGQNEDYAAKFQLHSDGSGFDFIPGNGTMDIVMNSFEKEVQFQIKASLNGISPVVYNDWTEEYNTIWGKGEHDVLIMDKLHETIIDVCRKDLTYNDVNLLHVIDNMHSINIFHGDLHSANIMRKSTGEPMIIDFGKSKTMPEGDEERKWCILHDLLNLFSTLPNKSSLKMSIKERASRLGTRALGMDFDFSIYNN